MGDLQIWAPQPNGFSIEDQQQQQLFQSSSSSSSSSISSSNPNPLSISDDCWLIAEQTTHEIICQIQPTLVSEQRRKVVVEYVQRLIRGYLGSEVFPFGSVPLKTYLPDGDIDLTALSFQNVEDALANDVRLVLEGEEQNNAAEFEVKDVQYIHAEVKLVKCLVQNIVVDISFNQIGGLCTLCFLEQVDRLIGKDHLFKRSIILIKAWCYYESRILGAHHGLISTYALETLVLYIFHVFHSSLNGPLAVLYRFLDYYSKFDWDNYCISLNGPVNLSSLPEIVADTSENGGDDLLLSQEFLRNCGDMFSVPSKGLETNSRAFLQKHLNIVDPLKENNNLGRSVSKGNFYRIRSAFTYGARKLGRILLLPEGSVVDELNKFFLNTLDRHGGGQRPDVQDPMPTGAANWSNPETYISGVEKCTEGKLDFRSAAEYSSCTTSESMLEPLGLLSNGISDVRISGTEQNLGHRIANETDRYSMKAGCSSTVSETNGPSNGNAISGYRLVGDAKDLATTRTHVPRIITETTKSTSPSSESDASPLARPYDEPHLYFSHSFHANGKIGSGKLDQIKPTNSGVVDSKSSSSSMLRPPEEQNDLFPQQSPEETKRKTHDAMYSRCYQNGSITSGSTEGLLVSSPGANISEDLCNSYREEDPAESDGSPGALSTLSDLSGDYDCHFKSLLYGQWCHEYGFCGSVMPIPPPPPAQFRNKHGWDSFHRPMSLKRNVFPPHMNANGAVSGPQFYAANPSMMSGAAFGVEEMPKPRGTGTYFPNTNNRSYTRDRPLPGKGRNPGPVSHSGHLHRPPRENGWGVTHPETNMLEKGSRESPTQRHFPVLSARGKPEQVEFFQAGRPGMRGFSHSNGFSLPDKLEFGSFGHPPLGTPPPDLSRQPVSSAPQTPVSTSSLPTPTTQRPKPSLTIDTERIAVQSYHLRDDDFPPLSV